MLKDDSLHQVDRKMLKINLNISVVRMCTRKFKYE